jgi:hypothetical protein
MRRIFELQNGRISQRRLQELWLEAPRVQTLNGIPAASMNCCCRSQSTSPSPCPAVLAFTIRLIRIDAFDVAVAVAVKAGPLAIAVEHAA